MKILKYYQFSEKNEILIEFVKSLDENLISESNIDGGLVDSILKNLSRDLKFNISLVFTFGTGIKAMIPIVDNLIKNGNFKIEPTLENIVLLTLTSLSICYLENSKNSKVSKPEVKSMLEELKMRGIGNGIVKIFVKVLNSIGSFVKNIFKNTGYAISGLFEMLGYTSLMLPFMNAISYVVGKYDLNPESLVGNLLSIGLSLGAFSGKNIINTIVKKLKDKIEISVSGDLEKPVSVKSYDAINDSENH
jgi:hypothetical protein